MNDHLSHILATYFPGAVQRGEEWWHPCPAHQDDTASFSMRINESGDKILMKCFAKCDPKDICAAVGMPMKELFMPKGDTPRPQIVEIYDYTDADGQPLYQVVRLEPGRNGEKKTFAQRRRVVEDGKARWEWSTKGVDKVLYRLSAVLSAVQAGQTIFIAEGERKVHILEKMGFVGTCNAGGAVGGQDSHKWLLEYTLALAGARVVILPDNDVPGAAHAAAVARTLQGIAASVKVVELPGLPAKGDIVDWVKAGHTRYEFVQLVEQAGEWEATAVQPEELMPHGILHHVSLVQGDLPAISWVIKGLFPTGGINIIGGDSGVGKSWITLHLAQCVAAGLPFLGEFAVTPGKVLVLDAESGPMLLARRVKKLFSGLRVENEDVAEDLPIRFLLAAMRFKPDTADKFAAYLLAEDIKLVLVDPLIHFCGVEENSAEGMANFFEIIRGIIAATGATFVFTHHSRKESRLASNAPGQMLRGSSAIRAILDSHLFIRRLKGEHLVVEHDKSRHAEPVPSFIIEIADTDETTTVVRYIGAVEDSIEKFDLAQDCAMRALTDAGGALARKEIVAQAKGEGIAERTMERALAQLLEQKKVTKNKVGKSTVYEICGLNDILFEEED